MGLPDRRLALKPTDYEKVTAKFLRLGGYFFAFISSMSNPVMMPTTANTVCNAVAEIKNMRNIVAHSCGHVDHKIVWNTANNDIPELRAFCEAQIAQ